MNFNIMTILWCLHYLFMATILVLDLHLDRKIYCFGPMAHVNIMILNYAVKIMYNIVVGRPLQNSMSYVRCILLIYLQQLHVWRLLLVRKINTYLNSSMRHIQYNTPFSKTGYIPTLCDSISYTILSTL